MEGKKPFSLSAAIIIIEAVAFAVVEFTHTLCPECPDRLYPKSASRSPS